MSGVDACCPLTAKAALTSAAFFIPEFFDERAMNLFLSFVFTTLLISGMLMPGARRRGHWLRRGVNPSCR